MDERSISTEVSFHALRRIQRKCNLNECNASEITSLKEKSRIREIHWAKEH